MTSPQALQPSYKNLTMKHKISIKEKMRKDYRNKIHDCREMLLNRFRGPTLEVELRDTLTDIYKNMLPSYESVEDSPPEISELEEIKSELVQEELEWWLAEYEKSQLEGVDWSAIEQNNDVICPLCQKVNLTLDLDVLKCSKCAYEIDTPQTLAEIKKIILNALEKHSTVCDRDAQFSLVQEGEDKHIILMCYHCSEMQLLI